MTLLQKNNKGMYPCIKCGLLTHNGRSKICRVCDPDFKRVSELTTSQKTKNENIYFPLEPERPGRRLFDLEICKGKIIENTEFRSGNLIITFADNTYIELYGDNPGIGGYIAVVLTRAERRRRDKLRAFGYKCLECRHQWLPKKLFSTPGKCPHCRQKNIVDILSTYKIVEMDEFD